MPFTKTHHRTAYRLVRRRDHLLLAMLAVLVALGVLLVAKCLAAAPADSLSAPSAGFGSIMEGLSPARVGVRAPGISGQKTGYAAKSILRGSAENGYLDPHLESFQSCNALQTLLQRRCAGGADLHFGGAHA